MKFSVATQTCLITPGSWCVCWSCPRGMNLFVWCQKTFTWGRQWRYHLQPCGGAGGEARQTPEVGPGSCQSSPWCYPDSLPQELRCIRCVRKNEKTEQASTVGSVLAWEKYRFWVRSGLESFKALTFSLPVKGDNNNSHSVPFFRMKLDDISEDVIIIMYEWSQDKSSNN